MPNILAIDTSLPDTSVTLHTQNYYYSRQASAIDSHNEELAKLVDEVINEADILPYDLDVILLGAGPGSFTGLRIGYSFVQGLAIASNTVVNVTSSMFAGAYKKEDGDGLFIAISDARRGEYFCASLLVKDGTPSVATEPSIMSREEIDRYLLESKKQNMNVVLKDLNILAAHLSCNLISLWLNGEGFFHQYSFEELSGMKPLYIRQVAALTIEERRGR